MTKETEEKLARSLTAETPELLPFLPYLLQDIWEMGSSPRDMIRLIKKHIPISKDAKIIVSRELPGCCKDNADARGDPDASETYQSASEENKRGTENGET